VIYEERKVLGYKLMNFDIACWKLILKIYWDGGNNTDNYKNYYLKGHSGNLSNCCLYKACYGRP